MYAVFKTGGKQYAAKVGQILKIEKIEGNKGDNFSFNNILAITDGSKNVIGSPLVKGASIVAKIINQIRDKKIIVFKKKKRKNYRLTQGHRQYLTVLKIESISLGSKKTTTPTTPSNIEKPKTTKKAKDTLKKTINKKVEKKAIADNAETNKTIKKKKSIKKTTRNKK